MRLVCMMAFGLAVHGCRAPEVDEELRVNVLPSVLNDDGTAARVRVSTNDVYAEPGTGPVHVQSSAGSLRDGVRLVLGADGTAETQLVCDVRQDADCHDTVDITVTWVGLSTHTWVKTARVTIRTTDAFVSACSFPNRRRLMSVGPHEPTTQLAVLDHQPEVVKAARAVAFWDSTLAIGGLSAFLPARGLSPSREEAWFREALATVAPVRNPLVQTFTTWDDQPAAHSSFTWENAGSLGAALGAAAAQWGAEVPALSTSASAGGPFRAELLVVPKPSGEAVVVLALHQERPFSELAGFSLEDVAGGSSLASSTDALMDHCEIFSTPDRKKVDVIWVVDDSCSMFASQTAVATVGEEAARRLSASQLNFRVAGVSTGWYPPEFAGSYRNWSQSTAEMLGWFSGSRAWGVRGAGSERGFEALATLLEGRSIGAVRDDAESINVIFLSDTRDQSSLTADEMWSVLQQRFPKKKLTVSGILCPEGETCGDGPEDAVGKYHSLIRKTGGVLGSIRVFNPSNVSAQLRQEQADTLSRIFGQLVNGAGFQLKHRPITASIRVAASAVADVRCDNRDIPRSRDHGWDLDPATGTLAFYGWCVPRLEDRVVVSYKSWVRNGTLLHENGRGVFAVGVEPDGGAPVRSDAGTSDAGAPDAGAPDAGTSSESGIDGGQADAGR